MPKSSDYIWVAIRGCAVMGFLPKEIANFEEDFARNAKPYGVPYWFWFNLYFADDLKESVAYAYDALWNTDETYAWLNLIKAARGIGQ